MFFFQAKIVLKISMFIKTNLTVTFFFALIILSLLCSDLNRCTVFHPLQLTLKDTRSLPVQVDGEPWEEGPCVITITHHNQALMLGKGEKQLLS